MTRIGSRWPSFRAPAPRVPATDLLASGRTAAGTEYELRFGARDSRLRRSGWSVELMLREPGERHFENGGASYGRGRPPSRVDVSMSGRCGSRPEAFVMGWAPPDVAGVALIADDGTRIETRLLALEGQESRLLFAPIDGVPRVAAVEVVDRDGMTDIDRLESPHDPCGGDADADGAGFIVNYWNLPGPA